MEGHCSTGQSPQWAVVPMEEEEEVLEFNKLFAEEAALRRISSQSDEEEIDEESLL